MIRGRNRNSPSEKSSTFFLFLNLLHLSLHLHLFHLTSPQNVSRASAAYSDAGDIPDRSGRSSFETSPGGSQHEGNAFSGGGGFYNNQNQNPNLGRPSLARSSASGPSAARAPVMSGEWTTRSKSIKRGNIRASSAFSAKGHGSSGGGGGDDEGKDGTGVNPGKSFFFQIQFFFLLSLSLTTPATLFLATQAPGTGPPPAAACSRGRSSYRTKRRI